MRCPTCGNSEHNTYVYRCARCGFVYCVTLHPRMGYARGCHYANGCPRCFDKRAITIGRWMGWH